MCMYFLVSVPYIQYDEDLSHKLGSYVLFPAIILIDNLVLLDEQI